MTSGSEKTAFRRRFPAFPPRPGALPLFPIYKEKGKSAAFGGRQPFARRGERLTDGRAGPDRTAARRKRTGKKPPARFDGRTGSGTQFCYKSVTAGYSLKKFFRRSPRAGRIAKNPGFMRPAGIWGEPKAPLETGLLQRLQPCNLYILATCTETGLFFRPVRRKIRGYDSLKEK